jgi:MFS family permease
VFESRDRFRAIALLAIAELLAMGLWFGVSAVAPQLSAEWNLSSAQRSWLTVGVQLGFVAGTLLSAFTNLPDVLSPRLLFAASATVGAVLNGILALKVDDPSTAIAMRFLTGVCLAGVYPPGMKIVATWFRTGRGLALGVLIGALTLGKGSPYLVNVIGSESWRTNVLLASLLAFVGALIVLFGVSEGPHSLGRAPFNAAQALEVFRSRPVRLANFGYFGHMWELYAMWTWLPVMLRASARASGSDPRVAEISTFVAIAAGAVGCVAGGALADRFGRTVITSVAMAISGGCCLVVGLAYGHPWLLLLMSLVWGASVIADSAQFSACVTELSDPRYLGTAVTMQTCLGFLLTTASISLLPYAVDVVGWRWAFAVLAIGPLFGTVSMLRLRQLPEAAKLAGGKR